MKGNPLTNLVWIDMEMTGLDETTNSIIEIACIITDKDLNEIAEGPVIQIFQPELLLAKMDDWNVMHHTKSGLLEKVRNSQIDITTAEKVILEFVQTYVDPQSSPLCGSSVHVDRRFLRKYMPGLNEYLHYQIIDVTTITELYKRWHPGGPRLRKKNLHTALSDIKETIDELRYFKAQFFK